MPARQTTRVSSRKQPQQARSTDLVAAVLDAAVQVLTTDGARRFTTARVAARAGVSVGSLYQYFPNKAAILFRLQSDEWRRTAALLRTILEDRETPPPERVRTLVHAFIRSECEEAAIRIALHDAAPLYRDAPEAIDARAATARVFHDFLREALPHVAEETRSIAGRLIKTTLSACGSSFSETPRTPAEIDAYSDALADMLCAYLEAMGGGAAAPYLPGQPARS
ncbi:MAG TPA: TetR family transcriptional regulator [Sphingomonas sp.]|nr:TetR family transcriptional regulator [Sphingomonas sp.]